MKLINYQLQTQIETLSDIKSQEFFKEYIQNILEDESKQYYQKADYVGLSLNTLKEKVDDIASNIKELQTLKKRYTESLDIARTLTADVLTKNGVDRIDGNLISSITLSKPTTKTKDTLTIKDEKAVMSLGYVKFEPDTEAILKAMATDDGKKELSKLVQIDTTTIDTPSKVKVNTKRAVNNTTITTDEIMQLKAS